MDVGIGIIVGLWLVFVVYWAISSVSQKRAVERPTFTLNDIAARILFAIPFPMLVRPEWISAAYRVLPDTVAIATLGVLCGLVGLVICIWARRALASNWSKNIDFKEDHKLVQSGPYKFVRHPIYTGFLLLFLGSALVAGFLGGFIGFLALGAGCYLRIRQEEALMLKHFSARYTAYKRRTKALIPGVL